MLLASPVGGCPTPRARELLLVLDPGEQRLRVLRPVELRQLLEVRDARYGALEEALQALEGLGDVRGGVVGDCAERDRASWYRHLASSLRCTLIPSP